LPLNAKAYIDLDFNFSQMSEGKRKSDETTSKSISTTGIIDVARDNTIRMIDEFAKAQPQYSQAISNFQTDFIQTTRNLAQTVFETQKQIAQNFNIPQNPQVSELVARQATEMTNNMTRAFGTYNQLALNTIDAARENTKIFNRTVDAVTDFNTNIMKAWSNYWAAQQQQFTRTA
jgi:hypothetical protein